MNFEGNNLEGQILEGLKKLTFTPRKEDSPKVAMSYVNAFENTWNVIKLNPAISKNDSRILASIFIFGLLGDACTWKNSEQRKDLATSDPQPGIDVWMQRFRKRYIPPRYMEVLIEELYNLKEKGDITIYANKFAQLEETIGTLPKEEADRIFKHGLSTKNKARCKRIIVSREDIIVFIRIIEGLEKQEKYNTYGKCTNTFKSKDPSTYSQPNFFEAIGKKRIKRMSISQMYKEDLTEELYSLKEKGDITIYANKFSELERTIGNLPKEEADKRFIYGLSIKNKKRCLGIVTSREDIIHHIRSIEDLVRKKSLERCQ